MPVVGSGPWLSIVAVGLSIWVGHALGSHRIVDSPGRTAAVSAHVTQDRVMQLKGGKPAVDEAVRNAAVDSSRALSVLMPCWERVEGFSEAQVKEALVWLKSIPKGLGRAQVTQMLFFRWGEIDPITALAGLHADADLAPWREEELAVLAAWSRSDPEAAMGWVETEGTPPLRSYFAKEEKYQKARKDARAAAAKSGKSPNANE